MTRQACERCGESIEPPPDPPAGKFRCPLCHAVNLVPVEQTASVGLRLAESAQDAPPQAETGGTALLTFDAAAADDEAADPVDPATLDWALGPLDETSAQTPADPVVLRVKTPLWGGARLAIGLGVAAAVGLGVIWAGLAYLTGWPLGVMAVVIGAVTAWTASSLMDRRNQAVGLLAVGLTVLACFSGKALIAAAARPALSQHMSTADPDLIRAAVGRQMIANRAFDPALQEALDHLAETGNRTLDKPPGSLNRRIEAQVQARVEQMPPAQRRAAVAQLLRDEPGLARLHPAMPVFSIWDIGWLALALALAYRLAAGPRPVRKPSLVLTDPE